MKRCFAMFAILVMAGVFLAGGVTSGQVAPPKPNAPLALATGDSVSLAFSLPATPRPHRIQVLRSTKEGTTFSIAADLDASVLAWVDKDVTAGKTYVYAIRTQRGPEKSEISQSIEVTVGGSARVTLLGGSLDRALFEVVLYKGGKKVSARFVHKAGEKIGDLAWVDELDGVADFRLGPTLVRMSLTSSEALETQREALKTADGSALTDLAGRPLELDFKLPTGNHEVVQVTLLDAKGQPASLREGESLKIE